MTERPFLTEPEYLEVIKSAKFETYSKAPIRSVAGHVLATGEATDDEALRLAGAVLGEDAPTPSVKSKEDMTRILAKIDGIEGQGERANAIRAQLGEMGDE